MYCRVPYFGKGTSGLSASNNATKNENHLFIIFPMIGKLPFARFNSFILCGIQKNINK